MSIAAHVHEVRAVNLSAAAENKIHDDTIARTYGFTGALVPGVEVYAYMSHVAVARFGRAWLERGTAECRFVSPVYDGDTARVSGRDEDAMLALAVTCNERSCATGLAGCPVTALPRPALGALPTRLPPERDARPPASEASLAVGTALGVQPWTATADEHAAYLRGVGETHDLYRRERLVHPGQILRLANAALVQNVVLGPWVHVGSRVTHYGLAHIGETLTLHGRVTANDVRKGHAFVDLDVLVIADGAQPIARIAHTAIWRLRSGAPPASGR